MNQELTAHFGKSDDVLGRRVDDLQYFRMYLHAYITFQIPFHIENTRQKQSCYARFWQVRSPIVIGYRDVLWKLHEICVHTCYLLQGLELHAMCFVFKTAVVFLCKERLRQKKKSLIVSLQRGQKDVEMLTMLRL